MLLSAFNDKQINALNTLKQALVDPSILALSRPDLPFCIDTYACEYQTGASLMETHKDDPRHPIGYWSQSLNPAEKTTAIRKLNF